MISVAQSIAVILSVFWRLIALSPNQNLQLRTMSHRKWRKSNGTENISRWHFGLSWSCWAVASSIALGIQPRSLLQFVQQTRYGWHWERSIGIKIDRWESSTFIARATKLVSPQEVGEDFGLLRNHQSPRICISFSSFIWSIEFDQSIVHPWFVSKKDLSKSCLFIHACSIPKAASVREHSSCPFVCYIVHIIELR